jgi:hypothetical protein
MNKTTSTIIAIAGLGILLLLVTEPETKSTQTQRRDACIANGGSWVTLNRGHQSCIIR